MIWSLGGGCKKKHSYRNIVFPKHDREKFGALELIQGTHKVSNHTHTHTRLSNADFVEGIEMRQKIHHVIF